MIEEFSDGTRVIINNKDEFLEIAQEFFEEDYIEADEKVNLLETFNIEDVEMPEDASNPIEAFQDTSDVDLESFLDEELEEVFVKEAPEEPDIPVEVLDDGRLHLTEVELNTISSVSRERKFLINKTEMLYNKLYTSKITTFLNNFRFLTSVLNAIPQGTVIEKKIKVFLNHYKELNDKLLELNVIVSDKNYFGRSRYKRKATKIVFDNDAKINMFVDSLYSVGKVVSQYNPDEAVGALS